MHVNSISLKFIQESSIFLKYFRSFIYLLFIFDCIGSSLLHTGFLQLWRVGATLHCSARASHCGGFSCCRAQPLGVQASVAVACGLSSCGSWALERRLSNCGTRAQLLRSMWDLPGPGIEPVEESSTFFKSIFKKLVYLMGILAIPLLLFSQF